MWTIYFDGASNQKRFGLGIFLVPLKGTCAPILVKLDLEVTNNVAKYEVCAIGLQTAVEISVKI